MQNIAVSTHRAQAWRPKRVLLLFPTVGYFPSLLRIAKVLRENEIAEPIIYAPCYFPGTAQLQERAADNHIPYLCFMKPDFSGYFELLECISQLPLEIRPAYRPVKTIDRQKRMQSWHYRLKYKLIMKFCLDTWLEKHAALFDDWIELNSALFAEADLIIDQLDVDLFVSPDETFDYNSQFFLASIRGAHKSSMLLPIAVPSLDEVDSVLVRNENCFVDDKAQKLFALLFPKWIRRVSGYRLSRCPIGRALATEADSVAPHYPWMSFTSGSDVIGLNSAYLRDRHVELSAAHGGRRFAKRIQKRMLLVGSPDDDDIVARSSAAPGLRRELAEMFIWTDERPIALINPVGDLRDTWHLSEFGSYSELLKFWLSALKGFSNFHVIISPHPSFRFREEERRILDTYGTNIVWRGVTDLIPACDLYMSFGGSSTIRLAAAAGLPVLNYLCYDVKRSAENAKSYFDGFDTILVARNSDQLTVLIDELNHKETFAQLRERGRQAAGYFGVQNGRFSDRLADVVSVLTNAKGKINPGDLVSLRRHLERAASLVT